MFNHVRKLFAATKTAKTKRYDAGRFSFNVAKGRCDTCEGEGFVSVELLFMPSVYAPCPTCRGARYNEQTLKITWNGRNVAEVPCMTVEEACAFFAEEPSVLKPLVLLCDIGLGYLRLGQPATELSGVLDPVAHHATAFRRGAIDQLLAHQLTIIRGNASEILALSGITSHARGVDSRDAVEVAEGGAIQLARQYRAVIAVTGPIDFLTDGKRSIRFSGGSLWMPRVTAMGCAQTCVMGAMVGARPELPFEAAAVALAVFKRAGELAAMDATGPGSFQWRFIDALASPDEHLIPTGFASDS